MHRFSIIIICQLFVFSNAISQISIDHWESLVNSDNTWRYYVGNSEPPSAWMANGFDDGSWSEGPGGFGYGDDDDATVITNASAVYLRLKFIISNLEEIEEAVLLADFDDGFIAYINAREIARYGLSGDKPPFNQFADENHEAELYRGIYPSEYRLKKSNLQQYLVKGENILAIQVHNINATSSDLSSNFYFLAGLNVSTSSYQPVPSWFREPLNYNSSNLPIIKVDTKGKFIPDEPKINAMMRIIDNGPGAVNHVNDSSTDYNGPIGIEMRGSSSQDIFPKKQYAVELWTKSGQDTSASILGLPEEEDWILGAPYSDKSLIRNLLTYKLGADLGWYAPRTKMVELYLNENYQGVYMLTEKIKRDKNRVDISKLNPDENSGDDLTGGYIIKIDKTTGAADEFGWHSPFPSIGLRNGTILFQHHYPRGDEITAEQKNYIRHFITEFEQVLNGPNFRDSQNGYRSFINAASFIDYSIMNELTKNIDGYRLSTFLYKDKDSRDGKLYIGPLWDFNLAFGNADYCQGSEIHGFEWDFNAICGGEHGSNPFWWKRLLRDPGYVNQYQKRWLELRESVLSESEIMAFIDSTANVLEAPQQRNYERWPVLHEYVWPNNFVGGTYANEIAYLKSWIKDRLSWLDTNISRLELITDLEDNFTEIENPVTIYPNPNSGVFHLRFKEFPNAGYSVKVFNQLGKIMLDKHLIYNNLIDDTYSFNEMLSPGFYVLEIGGQTGASITWKIIVH